MLLTIDYRAKNSLLTYKTINTDQIFQRDAVTNVHLAAVYNCSLTKLTTEYEILHKCLIKRIK